jgi:hypothetical protein
MSYMPECAAINLPPAPHLPQQIDPRPSPSQNIRFRGYFAYRLDNFRRQMKHLLLLIALTPWESAAAYENRPFSDSSTKLGDALCLEASSPTPTSIDVAPDTTTGSGCKTSGSDDHHFHYRWSSPSTSTQWRLIHAWAEFRRSVALRDLETEPQGELLNPWNTQGPSIEAE